MKAVTVFTLLIITAFQVSAQWVRTNGPGAVRIRTLLARNGQIFAGTAGNGVFVTADGGQTWHVRNNGLTMFDIYGFAQNDQFVFAAIPGSGIARTSDFGMNWQLINNGLTSPNLGHIASIGPTVITSNSSDLFRSENSGEKWSQVMGFFETYHSRVIDGAYYLGRFRTIQKSIDLGQTWQDVGQFPRAVNAIAKCGQTFFASSFQFINRGDLYRSSDGTNWTAVRQIQATTLDCINDLLVIGTLNDGVFLSNDAGKTLLQYSAGLGDLRVTSTVADGAMAYVGTESGHVYRRQISTPEAVTVSAASYQPIAPPDSIIAIFGQELATSTAVSATVPLPTELGGVTVNMIGANGSLRPLGLFFVTPGQINAALPPDIAESGVTLEINTPLRKIISDVTVRVHAPAIFSANADGAGPPAAYVVRVKPDNSQSIEPVAMFNIASGKYVEVPIIYGPVNDRLFLILFGSGFMRIQGPSVTPLNAQFFPEGSLQAQFTIDPSFRGPSPFVGVSQMNIRLNRPSLPTTYNVAILNDERFSNVVKVRLSP